MKRFIIILGLFLCTAPAFSQRIALITEKAGYYHLFNSQPRAYNSIPVDGKILIDYSSELIAFQKDDYYLIYNSVPTLVAKFRTDEYGTIVKVFDDASPSRSGFITLHNGIYRFWNRTGTKSFGVATEPNFKLKNTKK